MGENNVWGSFSRGFFDFGRFYFYSLKSSLFNGWVGRNYTAFIRFVNCALRNSALWSMTCSGRGFKKLFMAFLVDTLTSWHSKVYNLCRYPIIIDLHFNLLNPSSFFVVHWYFPVAFSFIKFSTINVFQDVTANVYFSFLLLMCFFSTFASINLIHVKHLFYRDSWIWQLLEYLNDLFPFQVIS